MVEHGDRDNRVQTQQACHSGQESYRSQLFAISKIKGFSRTTRGVETLISWIMCFVLFLDYKWVFQILKKRDFRFINCFEKLICVVHETHYFKLFFSATIRDSFFLAGTLNNIKTTLFLILNNIKYFCFYFITVLIFTIFGCCTCFFTNFLCRFHISSFNTHEIIVVEL